MQFAVLLGDFASLGRYSKSRSRKEGSLVAAGEREEIASYSQRIAARSDRPLIARRGLLRPAYFFRGLQPPPNKVESRFLIDFPLAAAFPNRDRRVNFLLRASCYQATPSASRR